MKKTKLLALLAFALIAGANATARAEEQTNFPVQYQIEVRQIHPVHSLRGMHGMMMVSEGIAPAVMFNNGSDKLSPAAADSVAKTAQLIKTSYKGRHILVSGYTDSTGKDAANQRLSYHRATMVVKALVKHGVPASQLTAQGFGKENPVGNNATAEGRAMNRRVTFSVAR